MSSCESVSGAPSTAGGGSDRVATLQAGIIAAATAPKNAGGTDRRLDGGLDGLADGRSVSPGVSASSVMSGGAGGMSDGIRGGPGNVGMRGGGGNVLILRASTARLRSSLRGPAGRRPVALASVGQDD